ncbi:MAG TPA: sodium:proton exchanger, partial [Aggregicoccus sp.]|nr:sodium:proton exchanger [Aggregicoccus sp.]
ALRPVVALGLGLAGVIVGLHQDPRLLRLLPLPVLGAAAAHAGIAFLFVAAPLAFPLVLSSTLAPAGAVGAAALLGAAASLSSGHFAVLGYRSGRLSRLRGLSIALLTTLDDVVALGVLALALVLGAASSPTEGLGLVSLALLTGLACGALLTYLTRGMKDPAELAATLLGGVALVSGAAAFLRISALLAGVACGATLTLMSARTVEQVARALGRFERPAYLILVFFAGCFVDPRDTVAWLLLPLFLGLRFLGKFIGGAAAVRLAGGQLSLPPRLGYALIAQGGLAVCLVLEYLQLVPGRSSQHLFDVVVLGVLVNEVLAQRAFQALLGAHPAHPAHPPGSAS